MENSQTQPYQVIKTDEVIEIRHYPAAIMASVSMQINSYKELSSTGFRKLASYFFGGNEKKDHIDMVSPVHVILNDTSSSISFVIPPKYLLGNLPVPNDSNISLNTSDDEYIAVLQFNGIVNDDDIKIYSAILEEDLKGKNIEYYGDFRFLGYNAPFHFSDRKNEIAVSVRWNG